MRRIRIAVFCSLAFLWNINTALACGPDLDDAYLVRGSKEHFLAIPEGSFRFELERIAGQKEQISESGRMSRDGEEPCEVSESNTANADIKDLEEACANSGLAESERQKIIESYAVIRSQIQDYLKAYPDDLSWYGGRFRHWERDDESYCGRQEEKVPVEAPVARLEVDFNLPEGTPMEFRLYLEGAVAYHNDDFAAAIEKWKDLLALPQSERCYKTVWASFMIGKAYLSIRKPKEAIPYCELTRKEAREGYKDSLELSYESYGWQALAEYENGDHVPSIHHYFEQLDARSLSWLCDRIVNLDESAFRQVFEDNLSRKVLIGWAVSRAGYSEAINTKLLNEIEEIDPQEVVENADRMAWLYYNKGDIDKTKRWLALAQEKTALAKFVMAKLMLREGNIESAIGKLEEVLPLMEKTPDNSIFSQLNTVREVNSELGVLKLSRKEYISALDALLKGRYWEDVAYVAEKALTSAELEDYLKARQNDLYLQVKILWFETQWYDETECGIEPEWDRMRVNAANVKDARTTTVYEALRYLLARRFVREGSWSKAIEYMPTSFTRGEWQGGTGGTFNPKEETKSLADYLEKARNPKLPSRRRAKGYYEAGRIVRKYGMELLGTELDPDWFVFGGQFEPYSSIRQRFGIVLFEDRREDAPYRWVGPDQKNLIERSEIQKNRGFFNGSEDEEKRALASLPSPDRRFHYRYIAADLMSKCADLLPNNDDLKAQALCLAGTYLKNGDIQAADKFYKALVRTCGKTELGKAADKLKWFPPCRPDDE